MKIKRNGAKTPVVMVENRRGRRRLLQTRGDWAEPDAVTGPLPGQMLVLLSRLHRSERPRSDDEDHAV